MTILIHPLLPNTHKKSVNCNKTISKINMWHLNTRNLPLCDVTKGTDASLAPPKRVLHPQCGSWPLS